MTIEPYHGVWLPLITPFRDGALDEASLRRLVQAYVGRVDGFILGATTGEGMALSPDETERVVHIVAETLAGASRILIGLGGAATAGVIEAVRRAQAWPGDGFLITCPYYVRPSQEGMRRHFEAIADSTDRDVLIYNIPYRTGVNLLNETMLRLAERTNIVGAKDCCADPAQSLDLIRRKPPGFSVLTGEDAGYAAALRQGADGAILASAHVHPEAFTALYGQAGVGDWEAVDAAWRKLSVVPALLFAEPSPAALKHWLWRIGLIDSPELRLPVVPVSEALAARIDALIKGT